jgi:hypothetical protein
MRRTTHTVRSSVFIACLSFVTLAAAATAQDLSKYRKFSLGAEPSNVIAELGANAPETKTLYDRPDLIQEMRWDATRTLRPAAELGSVRDILFSFYNGRLQRMVVTYDRGRTEGLTADDMIAAISATYGTPSRPEADIIFPSIFSEKVPVLARWEDDQHSVNLVRSSYKPSYGLILYSKVSDAAAQGALTRAINIESLEAPQRRLELEKAQADAARVQTEKARVSNKESFRP